MKTAKMLAPFVSRLFIYTAIVAVVAGAAMAPHRPIAAGQGAVAAARPASALS